MQMEIKSFFETRPQLLLPVGLMAFCCLLATAVGIGYEAAVRTPVEVSMRPNSTDSKISQRIRDSVRKNKSLSPFSRGVEIVSHDGKVTLRGLVQTENEKNNLQSEAVAVVGNSNVSNQLEIALPGSGERAGL
jgi:osmotically-inducible protein OsmY